MKRMQFGKRHNKKNKNRQSVSRWHGVLAFFLCISLLLSLLMPSTSYSVFDSIPAKADSDDLIKVYQDDTLRGEYEDLAAAFAAMQQEDASYRVCFENAEGVYTIEGDVVLPKAKCITFAGTHKEKDSITTMSGILISGDWKCQSDIEMDDVSILAKRTYGDYVFSLGSYTLKLGEHMKNDGSTLYYNIVWRSKIVGEKGSRVEAGFENGSASMDSIIADTVIIKNAMKLDVCSASMPSQVSLLLAESGTELKMRLYPGQGNKNDCIRCIEIRENETYQGDFNITIYGTFWAKKCLKLGNIYSYQNQNASFNLGYDISIPDRIHIPMVYTELLGYLSAYVDMKVTLHHQNLEQWKYQKRHFLLKASYISAQNIRFIEDDSGTDTDLEPYVDEKTGLIMLSKTALNMQEDSVLREEVLSLNENNVDEKYNMSYKLDKTTQTAMVTGSTLKEDKHSVPSRIVVIPEYVEKDGSRYSVTAIAPDTLQVDDAWIDKLYISDNVKKISDQSFRSGTVLHIWIGKGVEYISPNNPFNWNVDEISVDPENPYFMSEFGYLYTKNQGTLLKLTFGDGVDPERLRRFEVPNTVKKIEAYAGYIVEFCTDFVYPNGTQLAENALAGTIFALHAGTAQELTEDFEQLVLESMDTLTPDFPIRQPDASASPSPTASTTPDATSTPTASSFPNVSEKPETSMTPMPSPSVTPAATPTPTSTPTPTPIQTSDAEPTPTKTPAVTLTPTQASDIEPTKQPNDNSNTSNRQPLQTASPSKQPYQTETIRLQKPALGMITLTKAAYPVICWNKVNRASGYEVWRATGDKMAFKKLHTVSGKAVCRYIDSKARSGQKYRYRIRAFYKKGGKISYSAYSRIKEIGTYLLKKPLIRGGSGKTADGRSYVWISLKRYAGNRIQIYYRIKKGKWIRLKLVTDRIPKKNSRFMILCKRKYKSYDFQVRTHEKRKGKKQYSPLSNITRIFMEKKE